MLQLLKENDNSIRFLLMLHLQGEPMLPLQRKSEAIRLTRFTECGIPRKIRYAIKEWLDIDLFCEIRRT